MGLKRNFCLEEVEDMILEEAEGMVLEVVQILSFLYFMSFAETVAWIELRDAYCSRDMAKGNAWDSHKDDVFHDLFIFIFNLDFHFIDFFMEVLSTEDRILEDIHREGNNKEVGLQDLHILMDLYILEDRFQYFLVFIDHFYYFILFDFFVEEEDREGDGLVFGRDSYTHAYFFHYFEFNFFILDL